jgi:intracellular sulfur oxidation DsrE/DsrF family protein
MDRRFLFRALFGGTVGVAAVATRASAAPGPVDPAKVTYHIADFDKAGFALGNIANHYEGMGGPDKVRIALVVIGPAVRPFLAASAPADLVFRTARLAGQGLELWACGNTLRGMKLTVGELLPGFRVAERGGVVKLAELQGEGFCYLRP